MKKLFTGSITFVLIFFNAIWIILAVIPPGLLRFLPSKRIKIWALKFNEKLAEHFLNGNKFIQDFLDKYDTKLNYIPKHNSLNAPKNEYPF